MKKIVFLSLFIFIKISFADQLAWLTKDQAEKTVAYFNDNNIKQVVLWCACCDNDTKVKVSVTEVRYRHVKNSKEYYEFVIEGTYMGGEKLSDSFDLAYVHIFRDGKWWCLGKELGFECDPCTKPFTL